MTESSKPDHLVRDILAGRVRPEMSFAQKVWAVTARIPRGSVATYGQVARAVGGPDCRAARAVGQALNRNPHAPAVPCHRVVACDGRLTGYAGGLEKKRELLLAEGVQLIGEKVAAACRAGTL